MIKILHLSDIHMGSGFSHGRINPATGLNTRLEDFIQTLERCIDRAIEESVDLVLFGGDAFPDATPPPNVQEAFAQQFCRLVAAGIPTVLLVGNHDQHAQGQGGASLCIYRTLGVPGFIVGDRLETHRISTRHGDIQIITLPWLTRSTLLTRPETEGLSIAEVHSLLIERLRVALEGEIRRLDPAIPTVLLAHLMTDTAQFGAERFLAVGKGFTVPMTLLTRPCFDYVALGHVHRHQILSESPLVVYPGSIERVDFSEEKEEKGFVLVEVDRGQAQMEFCPLPVREFNTIKIDLSEADDPQAELLEAIEAAEISDRVVRLIYQIQSHQLDQIDNTLLYQALATAHSYTIQAELISQLARPRLPELGTGTSIDPIAALQSYLENQPHLSDISPDMLRAAQALLTQDEPLWLDEPYQADIFAESSATPAELNLLNAAQPDTDSEATIATSNRVVADAAIGSKQEGSNFGSDRPTKGREKRTRGKSLSAKASLGNSQTASIPTVSRSSTVIDAAIDAAPAETMPRVGVASLPPEVNALSAHDSSASDVTYSLDNSQAIAQTAAKKQAATELEPSVALPEVAQLRLL